MDNLVMFFNDDNLNKRYYTLLATIESANNSFFDVYNALIENILRKCVVDKFTDNVVGSTHTIVSKYKDFFLNEVNIDQPLLNKVLDYASKINKHKHNLEKDINLEIVTKYFKVLYDLIYTIALYYKFTIPRFNENYIISIYNSLVKSDDTNLEVKAINEKLDYILAPKKMEVQMANNRQKVERHLRLLAEDASELKSKLSRKSFIIIKIILYSLTILSTILGFSSYFFFVKIDKFNQDQALIFITFQSIMILYQLYIILLPKYIKHPKWFLIFKNNIRDYSLITLLTIFVLLLFILPCIGYITWLYGTIYFSFSIIATSILLSFPLIGYIYFRTYTLSYRKIINYSGYFDNNIEITKEEFDSSN